MYGDSPASLLPMNILITGGSGFIGQHLVPALTAAGHQVAILTRRKKTSTNRYLTYLEWNGREMPLGIGLYDVVINLAGASIAGARWTEAYKQEIMESRVQATRACVQYINRSPRPPQLFLSASAVGYYGFDATGEVDETSAPGDDFAAEVAQAWEGEAAQARCRTVMMRIAVVLGRDGGALEKMIPIYKAYLGGRFASGQQGFPWIHIDDVVGIIQWLIDQESVAGPVNVSAPEQVSQATFSSALADALGTKDLFIIPKFALNMIFGESAVLFHGGQYVRPAVLAEQGYPFAFPQLKEALVDAVRG